MRRPKGHYLSFERARAAVRELGLKSRKEWQQWSKSGARPNNIPSTPWHFYRYAGWVSIPDWMGYESVSFLPFERARAAVRKLGLKSAKEWNQWRKSGARPKNIPSAPDQVYRDAGWVWWPDWMGYEPRHTHKPPNRGTKRKRAATAAASSSSAAAAPPPPAAEVVPPDEEDYDNDCSVCFEPIPEDKRVWLRCSHWFCAGCVRDVAKTAAATAQEEGGGGGGLGRVSSQGVMVSCPMCRARVRVSMARE